MPSAMSALYTSSAERWRTLLDSNSSRILRRGSVALRPLSFRLCTVLIGCHYMRMVRTPRWMIRAALVGALVCAGAHAQGPVTERQAATYVYGGFLTDSAHAILSKDVKLGPELQRRLALPPDALIDPAKLVVRKAGPDELSRYAPRAGELTQPLFALESGDTTLLIQYDLQANNIPFVGQLAGSVDPIVAKKPAPPVAAEPPRPVVAPELPKEAILPPASRGTLRIPGITPYKIEIQQGNYVS